MKKVSGHHDVLEPNAIFMCFKFCNFLLATILKPILNNLLLLDSLFYFLT